MLPGVRCRFLGWAGVEIEHDGSTLLLDPLADPAATYARAGEAAANVTFPEVVAPAPGKALAGLLTHLHRDHADAGALEAGLADSAQVLLPAAARGDRLADAAIEQARRELDSAGLSVRGVEPWQSSTFGPFHITAVPAADGTGDPQLSWAVTAGGKRVIHCGDTLFHGWWWRAALAAGPFDAAFVPINGAVVNFPWRQPASPLPAVMTPEQAVEAARGLRASVAVGIHFGAFDLEPYYSSIPDALHRFKAAARAVHLGARSLEAGESLEL